MKRKAMVIGLRNIEKISLKQRLASKNLIISDLKAEIKYQKEILTRRINQLYVRYKRKVKELILKKDNDLYMIKIGGIVLNLKDVKEHPLKYCYICTQTSKSIIFNCGHSLCIDCLLTNRNRRVRNKKIVKICLVCNKKITSLI